MQKENENHYSILMLVNLELQKAQTLNPKPRTSLLQGTFLREKDPEVVGLPCAQPGVISGYNIRVILG